MAREAISGRQPHKTGHKLRRQERGIPDATGETVKLHHLGKLCGQRSRSFARLNLAAARSPDSVLSLYQRAGQVQVWVRSARYEMRPEKTGKTGQAIFAGPGHSVIMRGVGPYPSEGVNGECATGFGPPKRDDKTQKLGAWRVLFRLYRKEPKRKIRAGIGKAFCSDFTPRLADSKYAGCGVPIEMKAASRFTLSVGGTLSATLVMPFETNWRPS